MRPDHVYPAAELRRLARPCVYAWRRTGGRWLYVGRTMQGVGRFLYGHHVITLARMEHRRDTIAVWYCRNEEEAARLELELIRQHCPAYNVSNKPTSRLSIGERIRAGLVDICAHPTCRYPFTRDGQPRKRFCSAKCRSAAWAITNRGVAARPTARPALAATG